MIDPATVDINLSGAWPKELWDLFEVAHRGLSDGDLAPLRTLLLSPYGVPAVIRERLAKMIEAHADEPFKLRTKGKRPGQKTTSEQADAGLQFLQVGLFAEKRMRAAARGEFAAIILDTMNEFGVGKSTVTNSLTRVRAIIADNESRWPKENPVSAFDYMCDTFSIR